MGKLGVFTPRGAGEAQFILGEKYATGDGVAKDLSQAADFYRRAAESGNAKAQYEFGVLCESGEAFPRDFDTAVTWFRKSADQGYAPAQEKLGGLYAGRLVSTNLNESDTWIAKAIESYRTTAQQGDPDAQLRLGYLYRYWKGTNYLQESEKWYAAALDSFRKPAEEGAATAQVQLGILYSEGLGVQDDAAAIAWLRRAASCNDPSQRLKVARFYLINYGFFRSPASGFAKYLLAEAYEYGRGVPRSKEEAAKWYREAAQEGIAAAQDWLGFFYLLGIGVPKDRGEAIKWYERAAQQNYHLGLAHKSLGKLYDEGDGSQHEYEHAFEWYLKGAQQGFPDFPLVVAIRCAFGLGTPQDFKEAVRWGRIETFRLNDWGHELGIGQMPQDEPEAIKWFQKFTEPGSPSAQNKLAECFYYHSGSEPDFPEDPELASKWYRKAAEQGQTNAQYVLGLMYGTGKGVTKDYTEAFKWYRKAAEQGVAKAQCLVGYCYAKGEGVLRDYSEAYKWYSLAAAGGDEDAAKERDDLISQIAQGGSDGAQARPARDGALARPASVTLLYSGKEGIDVVEFAAKVTEQGHTYSRWAWKITVKNKKAGSQQLWAKMVFLDKEGFNLHETQEKLKITGGREDTFTGYDLIDHDILGKATKVKLSFE
jgi:TPR repeat protein